MSPIARTAHTTTARRRAAAHRVAEATVTAYLQDVSVGGRRRPAAPRTRVRFVASRPAPSRRGPAA